MQTKKNRWLIAQGLGSTFQSVQSMHGVYLLRRFRNLSDGR